MRLSRALVPLDYTSGDRIRHDPALALPPWPVLDPLRRLNTAAPGSDDARFPAIGAVRARNRVLVGVREGCAAFESVLSDPP